MIQNTLKPLISGPGNVPPAKTVLETKIIHLDVLGIQKNNIRPSKAIWRNNVIHNA
jgi:hypothetical protein